jgi:DNA-binding NtrC family response regulator
MKILIAENDRDVLKQYANLLKPRGYDVILTDNGEDCLIVYNDEFRNVSDRTDIREHLQPFDAVILAHRIPKIKGLDVAKEIISLNPHQRIIIASYYGRDVFDEASEYFDLPLEILQKPFFANDLLNMINDIILYDKLKKRLIDIEPMKRAKFRHEQLKMITDLLEAQDKKKRVNTDVR